MRHATRDLDALWVDAVGLGTADEVLAACVDALDLDRAPGDSLLGSLRRGLDDSGVLLVVDGLEMDDGSLGPVFQEIVEATTQARMVVTSTSQAGQPRERVVRVGPLPVPGKVGPLAGPSLEVFVERVRAAGGQVDLVAHEDEVRRLLRATGGLPLLIEQVAVQCALLGVTGVAPQATLIEAFRGSYDVLPPDAQHCLRRLAHLDSHASIDVLAAVCGIDLAQARDLAAQLVRRNLLEVHADGRFALLAPVRDFVLSRAEEGDRRDSLAGLHRWADAVAPAEDNVGAADAVWLTDFPAMRAAVLTACADPATRDLGYSLANRIFSSLYTCMRARDAVEVLEAALRSGDGPAAIGAQLARRAGIAASEVRGTYEGLWLLDRADEHAQQAPDPTLELARTAAIRAEMHLDAGDFSRAEAEAWRALDLDARGHGANRQAMRTLVDIHVSRAEFPAASSLANQVIRSQGGESELWISLSTRVLMGRTALEQGRLAEAQAFARTAAEESRQLAEDRIRLLAETLLRQIDPSAPITTTERTALPWSVRLPVLLQDARDLLESGDAAKAKWLAADVVALADSSQLGRDAVDARLILAFSLLELGDLTQAAQTFRTVLEQAVAMPMPLRVADVLDGMALVAQAQDQRDGRTLASAAAAVREHHNAAPWGLLAARRPLCARVVPPGWLDAGHLTPLGLRYAKVAHHQADAEDTVLEALTRAEREIADRVADGLTSRQIAEELFVSPRTVDSHLTNIYRKLDINSRARLAAMVADTR
ncbi:hypothetical protein FCL41_11280 [Nocardioides jishulii]|uniref:LuxR family transcriptional regulator n=1 Tax=Nocardioides jishulii TaxID=2575440 RepID=UPI00110D8766|nr:LuxR family transcriptional regulator [Nocardioides jishulii]QCX28034.1 hypothetical protein FCL41_11280 [Nocardioides jishulii]